MSLSLDYVLGSIPLISLAIGYMLMPMIWIFCGKKYVLIFWGINMLQALPYLLGYLGTTLPMIQEAHTNPLLPPYLPYITPMIGQIQNAGKPVALILLQILRIPITVIETYTPIWVQPILLINYAISLIALWFAFIYRLYIIETKYFLMKHLPFLRSWGLFSPKDLVKMNKIRDKKQARRLNKDKHI